eukprot:c24996_g1_i1 orf=241-1809(-)
MDSQFSQFCDARDFCIGRQSKEDSMDHDRIPVMLLTSESMGRSPIAGDDSLSAKRHRKLLSAAHMRRKKWTEEEEETLIAKYGELLRCGVLAKLKTRERKFQPIADHVNALHHSQDPIAFPWEWTWRDASIKVQNMRHQYLGVKQKIRRIVDPLGPGEHEEYDWEEGVNHWPTFLKYKEVFGDVELDLNDFVPRGSVYSLGNSKALGGQNRPWIGGRGRTQIPIRGSVIAGEMGEGMVTREGGAVIGAEAEVRLESGAMEVGSDALAIGMGLEYDGVDEDEEVIADTGDEDAEKENGDAIANEYRRKRRKMNRFMSSECRVLSFLAIQFAELREREVAREDRERQREKEREERALLREEAERERENQMKEMQMQREERDRIREQEREKREWAREEREREHRWAEQKAWEEERQRRREWEEKREKEKMEWRERMMRLQYEHHAMLMQVQAQLVQGQQNLVTLLLGVLVQLAGSGNDISGQVGSVNPFISQLLQNLQQPGDGIAQAEDKRAGGGSNNHQFLVDE